MTSPISKDIRSAPHERLGNVRPLGRGAFGDVFSAQTHGGARVAVKVFRGMNQEVEQELLDRELRNLRELPDSDFVVPVLWTGRARNGHPYIVMPLANGGSLQDYVGRLDRLALDLTMVNIASALDVVHGAGIVHRDVKPANILIMDGRPRLSDFGVSIRLSDALETQPRLTPVYAAPEVLLGQQASPASDVFSLGATILGAALGRPPRDPGSGIEAMARADLRSLLAEAGLARHLEPLIEACLQPEVDARPGAAALLQALPPGEGPGEWLVENRGKLTSIRRPATVFLKRQGDPLYAGQQTVLGLADRNAASRLERSVTVLALSLAIATTASSLVIAAAQLPVSWLRAGGLACLTTLAVVFPLILATRAGRSIRRRRESSMVRQLRVWTEQVADSYTRGFNPDHVDGYQYYYAVQPSIADPPFPDTRSRRQSVAVSMSSSGLPKAGV